MTKKKNVGRDARQVEDDVEMLLKETTASLLNSSKVELKAEQSLADMASQLGRPASLAGNKWQVLSVLRSFVTAAHLKPVYVGVWKVPLTV
jgi:hypothetical protein